MSEHAPVGAPVGVEEEHDAVESNRLGMWIFLATEILLFGGLFCAYAVYRSNHPEIFIYAHQFLSKTLGGINTIVLIGSSFTMAWAVRSAQLGESRRLSILLAITLMCGLCFLGIKSIEYEAKWKHGLLWGQHYKPVAHEGAEAGVGPREGGTAPATGAPATPGAPAMTGSPTAQTPAPAAPATPTAGAPANSATQAAWAIAAAPVVRDSTRSFLPLAAEGPRGLAAQAARPRPRPGEAPETIPKNVQIFFSIYFAMTGLHALHVIVGMTLIGIMLRKALRGEIGPKHFTGVDSVGLYWHLVDVIWIYLFPLLYLIK